MRIIVIIAAIGVLVASAVTAADAQTRRGSGAQQPSGAQQRTQTGSSYGLPDCSQRPFARECDRRGTW